MKFKDNGNKLKILKVNANILWLNTKIQRYKLFVLKLISGDYLAASGISHHLLSALSSAFAIGLDKHNF